MKRWKRTGILSVLAIAALSGFWGTQENDDLTRAKSTLDQIFKLFPAGHDSLFNEYYPNKTENRVTYLAVGDTIKAPRVAYLWPTSGVFSAVTALMKATGDRQYLNLLGKRIIPALEQYYDSTRNPHCYQSYIRLSGISDRYYDDNVWVAFDFYKLYMLTRNNYYLMKSVEIWRFVISGWDDNLGGGIYWCEQKKQSKNTCSNAPASVLALSLFRATRDSSYLTWGLRIYNWTRMNLQDSTDHLYFDNKNLSGKTDTKKYTYNSGQMLQSAALLYRLTGNKNYLDEAQFMAKSVIDYFTEDFTTAEGKKIRLFKNTGNWFNAVLLRGFVELYRIDGNKQYLSVFRDNMDQVWNHTCDTNGLFGKDWKGEKEEKYKWLLDQAGLVEMWAVLGEVAK